MVGDVVVGRVWCGSRIKSRSLVHVKCSERSAWYTPGVKQHFYTLLHLECNLPQTRYITISWFVLVVYDLYSIYVCIQSQWKVLSGSDLYWKWSKRLTQSTFRGWGSRKENRKDPVTHYCGKRTQDRPRINSHSKQAIPTKTECTQCFSSLGSSIWWCNTTWGGLGVC